MQVRLAKQTNVSRASREHDKREGFQNRSVVDKRQEKALNAR
jgi:hypothetical protein